MNRIIPLVLFPLLLLSVCTQLSAQIPEPFLEEYRFELGGSSPAELLFHDSSITGGLAQFRIHLYRNAVNETDMRLEVFRHQNPDMTSFALLLERVEVQLLRANGSVLRSIVLDKSLGPSGLFIIGDSSDGYFEHHQNLGKIAGLHAITVKLFGNYE